MINQDITTESVTFLLNEIRNSLMLQIAPKAEYIETFRTMLCHYPTDTLTRAKELFLFEWTLNQYPKPAEFRQFIQRIRDEDERNSKTPAQEAQEWANKNPEEANANKKKIADLFSGFYKKINATPAEIEEIKKKNICCICKKKARPDFISIGAWIRFYSLQGVIGIPDADNSYLCDQHFDTYVTHTIEQPNKNYNNRN